MVSECCIILLIVVVVIIIIIIITIIITMIIIIHFSWFSLFVKKQYKKKLKSSKLFFMAFSQLLKICLPSFYLQNKGEKRKENTDRGFSLTNFILIERNATRSHKFQDP